MPLHKTLAVFASVCLGLIGTAAARGDGGAAAPRLRMPDPLLSLRDMYPDLGSVTAAESRTREFQPRAPGVAAPVAARPDARGDLPVTSSWQRLGDFRSANSIRLLTLWQAAEGSIALHQGKHGSVMLQWTSHDLSRGAATRGLLDHLVSTVHRAPALQRVPATSGAAPREPAALRAAYFP